MAITESGMFLATIADIFGGESGGDSQLSWDYLSDTMTVMILDGDGVTPNFSTTQRERESPRAKPDAGPPQRSARNTVNSGI